MLPKKYTLSWNGVANCSRLEDFEIRELLSRNEQKIHSHWTSCHETELIGPWGSWQCKKKMDKTLFFHQPISSPTSFPYPRQIYSPILWRWAMRVDFGLDQKFILSGWPRFVWNCARRTFLSPSSLWTVPVREKYKYDNSMRWFFLLLPFVDSECAST